MWCSGEIKLEEKRGEKGEVERRGIEVKRRGEKRREEKMRGEDRS